MKSLVVAMAIHSPQHTVVSSLPIYLPQSRMHNRRNRRVVCSSVSSNTMEEKGPKPEYKPGVLDDFFLNSFRNKLVKGYYRKSDGIRRSLDMMVLLNWRKLL